MTPKKFAAFFLIQLVVFTVLKIWFFNNQIFGSAQVQNIILWIIIAVLSVALVRRFGVVHYLEIFAVIITWIILDLIVDFFITSSFTGLSIFKNVNYWLGFLVLALAVLFFHKKRHIHVRNELKKHHGGGHH